MVPLALLLIFILLYSTFNSTRIALMIYLNVPLAVTGGLIALYLRGYPFSISAGVGFIALLGVAVLNGVVLVSYILQMRESGATAEEAAALTLEQVKELIVAEVPDAFTKKTRPPGKPPAKRTAKRIGR